MTGRSSRYLCLQGPACMMQCGCVGVAHVQPTTLVYRTACCMQNHYLMYVCGCDQSGMCLCRRGAIETAFTEADEVTHMAPCRNIKTHRHRKHLNTSAMPGTDCKPLQQRRIAPFCFINVHLQITTLKRTSAT